MRILSQVTGACALVMVLVTMAEAGVVSATITDAKYGAVPGDGNDDIRRCQCSSLR